MIKLKDLKKLRKRAGLNRTELAAKIGVRERTICRWEEGDNIPHPERMKKLNRILGQLIG